MPSRTLYNEDECEIDNYKEIIMSLIRTKEVADAVYDIYTAPESSKKVLISAYLRRSQKETIDAISEQTGRGKGEVLRAIIDEWIADRMKR